jgi:phosphate transport system permease protein
MKTFRRKRDIEERIFHIFMFLSLFISIGSILLIIGTIVFMGLPALNLSLITQAPSGGFYLGERGGVLNAIAGSLYLAGGATLLSMIVSIPIVLFLNVYKRSNSKTAITVRFCLDVLWGVPSIVYGAFGFTLMLFFGLKASLLAGIITVAFLELPIMTRAMDEVLKLIPDEIKEASYSLGATRLETSINIVFRQALPGILTSILIAFGRGVGDAASVMFTAGFTDNMPSSLMRPVATLPLAIFFQLGTPFPEVQQRAYASALILTVIILFISIVSRITVKRFERNIIK